MNPNSNYKLKYANLIGLDAGEAAAKATKPNEQFGMGIIQFIALHRTNIEIDIHIHFVDYYSSKL